MEARLRSPPRYLACFLAAASLRPSFGSSGPCPPGLWYLNTSSPLSIPPPISEILIESSIGLLTMKTEIGSIRCCPRCLAASTLALMEFRNRLWRICLANTNEHFILLIVIVIVVCYRRRTSEKVKRTDWETILLRGSSVTSVAFNSRAGNVCFLFLFFLFACCPKADKASLKASLATLTTSTVSPESPGLNNIELSSDVTFTTNFMFRELWFDNSIQLGSWESVLLAPAPHDHLLQGQHRLNGHLNIAVRYSYNWTLREAVRGICCVCWC